MKTNKEILESYLDRELFSLGENLSDSNILDCMKEAQKQTKIKYKKKINKIEKQYYDKGYTKGWTEGFN
jgi:flagellar biosynthesis/type III secretory pathway protein FliH